MKRILILLLALTMMLSLAACGENSDETDNSAEDNSQTSANPSDEASNGSEDNSSSDMGSSEADNSSEADASDEAPAGFTVTVVDGDGNAVPGVMVQVCLEACIPAITDANGIAVFNVEITDGYKLSVSNCPEGYEYTGEAEIYLENGATEYTLELVKGA